MEPASRRTSAHRLRRRAVVGAVLAVTLSLTGCGGGPPADTGSTVSSSAQPRTTYHSKTFVVPFDVIPPAWQPTAPPVEQPNFVTWKSVKHAVRFLVPVGVYFPDLSTSSPTPPDYLAYLMEQSAHGAQFTSVSKTTVGDRAATLVTATTIRSLDGSLGCQKPGMAAGDCFGLQPDLSLRIAVVDLGGKTLLIWDRTEQSASDSGHGSECSNIRGNAEHRPVQ